MDRQLPNGDWTQVGAMYSNIVPVSLNVEFLFCRKASKVCSTRPVPSPIPATVMCFLFGLWGDMQGFIQRPHRAEVLLNLEHIIHCILNSSLKSHYL